MGFAPLYLLNRFVFRLSDFFHHWYIDGSRAYASGFMGFLSNLDRVFALRITIHFFWHPLYGDYTVIGRILGVIFRTARILIALAFYAVIALIALLVYLVWLAIPFVPLAMSYQSYIR